MSIKIIMPALSPTMTEGTLANWLIAEGDNVESGQVIAEIETYKATMEVEAAADGVLAKIIVKAGTQKIAVNSVIALLAEDGEDVAEVAKEEILNDVQVSVTTPNETASAPVAEKIILASVFEPVKSGKRIFASPLARRLAEQNGLDISLITGTAPHGCIVKRDIEYALANGTGSVGISRSNNAPTRSTPFEPACNEIPVTTMRGIIAQRLTQSKQEVPHFYITVDVEIDKLLSARKYLNDRANDAYKISVNDIVLKAVAVGLQEVPDANVSWAGNIIKQYKSVDISVAVAIEGGLITPIVRNADYKTIVEISNKMKSLVKKAKSGSLLPEEFQGGTVSVSNLGMFGVKQFNAIINPPHACILAVGAGQEKPVVKNGQLSVANVMTLTLSVDHRAVDGAVGAMFLKAIKDALEEPVLLML